MWLFWLLAFVPVFLGGYLYATRHEVDIREWLGGSAIAFAMAGLFQYMAFAGMTNDTETWSGGVTQVIHYPRWVEEVEHRHYDKKGNYTGSTYSYTTHHEYWEAVTSVQADHRIDQEFYFQLRAKLGGTVRSEWKYKSGFYSGDHNIYITDNTANFLFPVTAPKTFTNRVKAAPSLFSYRPVPPGSPVFEYPKNANWMASDRLLGGAKSDITLWHFDCMNARLGASKKVNVIMCGFPGDASSVADLQESKWIGGRKNDLVICYSNSYHKPAHWARVFGWTESDLAKKHLEQIMLEHNVDDSILPLIEAEIWRNYTIKDWSKFDYITIEPPGWAYVVYLLVMAVWVCGYWYWALNNEIDKEGSIPNRYGMSTVYAPRVTYYAKPRTAAGEWAKDKLRRLKARGKM